MTSAPRELVRRLVARVVELVVGTAGARGAAAPVPARRRGEAQTSPPLVAARSAPVAATVETALPARLGIRAEANPEAGLVTRLLASPQSLASALIVAEILAKPVALRDP